jgi:Fuc2NAc and GlcNAc transferase
MNGMVILASFLACVWLSWYITRRFVLFALERRLIDVPNERSSHSRVTPRGGGISFVVLLLATGALLGLLHVLPARSVAAILAGAGVALIGYLDDCRGVSIKARLLVQLVVSSVTLALVFGNPFATFNYPTIVVAAGALCAILLYTWLINLVNFMDGIDGLAASEAVCVCAISCFAAMTRHGSHEIGFLFGILACASLGFLYWNWPNAHVFMGDAGSCFLGFSIGALMLLGVARHELGLCVVPILLGVFVIDATVTLLRRMWRGEKWYKPHRLFAFHHAADVFGHRNVTVAVIAVNLLWLAPLALLAEFYPALGLVFLLIAWTPIVLLSYLFHSGEVLCPGAIPRWRTMVLIAHCTPSRMWGRVSAYALKLRHERMSWLRAALIACICFVSTYAAIPAQMGSSIGAMPSELLSLLGIFTFAQIGIILAFGLHRCHWYLLSLEELPDIVGTCLVATLASVIGVRVVVPGQLSSVPASAFLMQTLLVVVFVVVTRLVAASLSRDGHLTRQLAPATRVIVYGANAAGLEVFSNLRRLGPNYRIVGFVDPRISLKGVQIAGVRVLGVASDIKRIVSTYDVDEVLVSSSSTASVAGRRFVQYCQNAEVDFRIIPSIEHGLRVGAEAEPIRASA